MWWWETTLLNAWKHNGTQDIRENKNGYCDLIKGNNFFTISELLLKSQLELYSCVYIYCIRIESTWEYILIMNFQDVMVCGVTEGYQHSGETSHLHLHSKRRGDFSTPLVTWKWRQKALPKCVPSEKTAIFMVTILRTSNLTHYLIISTDSELGLKAGVCNNGDDVCGSKAIENH